MVEPIWRPELPSETSISCIARGSAAYVAWVPLDCELVLRWVAAVLSLVRASPCPGNMILGKCTVLAGSAPGSATWPTSELEVGFDNVHDKSFDRSAEGYSEDCNEASSLGSCATFEVGSTVAAGSSDFAVFLSGTTFGSTVPADPACCV